MLLHLHIQQYILIDNLDIDFTSGFSVVTGETGAGKSIMLGALNLLQGARADAQSIRHNANKCVIEATFNTKDIDLANFFAKNDLDYDAETCILRREINATGKSRAFINDTPVTLQQMRLLSTHLFDIHSQHKNLQIGDSPFQLSVLDGVAHDDAEINAYKKLYADFRQQQTALVKLKEELARQKSDEDYLRFQAETLSNARLRAGEQQELENRQNLLEHAQDISEALYSINSQLSGNDPSMTSLLRNSANSLKKFSNVDESLNDLATRIESCYIELKDIAETIDDKLQAIEANPDELARIEERLSTIYSLEQKFHVESEEDLVELQGNIEKRLSNISNGDEDLAEQEQNLADTKRKLLAAASALSEKRKKAAAKVEKEICERLRPMGIPNIQFSVAIEHSKEPLPSGIDLVRFLFSSSKDNLPKDIAETASGGEISRVMLALKAMIATKSRATIFFDEIDTGVSGRIAQKMAETMKQISKSCQVICISHLPQIASTADVQYLVYKHEDSKSTYTQIRRLTHNERIEEIAHMLSGERLTKEALENAQVLLAENSVKHNQN